MISDSSCHPNYMKKQIFILIYNLWHVKCNVAQQNKVLNMTTTQLNKIGDQIKILLYEVSKNARKHVCIALQDNII